MSDEVVEKFLTRAEVLKRVPVSRVTLWSWWKSGKFPQPRSLSGGQGRQNRIAFLESEVAAWLKSRPVRQFMSVAKEVRPRPTLCVESGGRRHQRSSHEGG